VTAEDAMVLVQQAKEALDPAVLDPDAAKGLRVMADLVGSA
jgi:hypothetical protein